MIARITVAMLLVFGFITAPLTSRSESAPKVARIGVLALIHPAFEPETDPQDRELVGGLGERGWTVGRNMTVVFRSAEGHPERLPKLAATLVAEHVDVLITFGSPATLAASHATSTVPIVAVGVGNPVEAGLIKSLAHPGGNVTGLAINAADMSAKRVQLLREAVPRLARVAVLWNASLQSMAASAQRIERAAPALKVVVHSVRVTGSPDLDAAFAALSQHRPDGLVVLYGPMRGNDRPRIVDFVTRQRIPAMFDPIIGVRDGGLLAFGPNFSKLAHGAGTYVDKIRKGAKAADLPVEQPTTFEFVINMKTAKALGLTIPPSLLLRADEIIQ